MFRYLPTETLEKLLKAVQTADLGDYLERRDLLLYGIDSRWIQHQREYKDASDQIRSDLQKLNDKKRLDDGTVPLQVWLKNALNECTSQCLPEAEKEVFYRALKTVEDVIASDTKQSMQQNLDLKGTGLGSEGDTSLRTESLANVNRIMDCQLELENAIGGCLYCLERHTYLQVFEAHLFVVDNLSVKVTESGFWEHGRELVKKLEIDKTFVAPPKWSSKLNKFNSELGRALHGFNDLVVAYKKSELQIEQVSKTLADLCDCIIKLQPKAKELEQAYHARAKVILKDIVDTTEVIVNALNRAEENALRLQQQMENRNNQGSLAWPTASSPEAITQPASKRIPDFSGATPERESRQPRKVKGQQ